MSGFGKFRFSGNELLQKARDPQHTEKDFTPEELMMIQLEMQNNVKGVGRFNSFDQLMKEIKAVDDRLAEKEEELKQSMGFMLGMIFVLLVVEVVLAVAFTLDKLQ